METKLKLLLGSLHLPSIVRAALWSLSLLWVWSSGFAAISALVFLSISVFAYFTPFFHTFSFPFSWLVLTLTAPLLVFMIPYGWQFWVATIFLGTLFFALLALKNLVLAHRIFWLQGLLSGCLFSLFFIFYGGDLSQEFLWKWLAIFFLSYFLTREFLKTLRQIWGGEANSVFHPSISRFFPAVSAFFISEAVWVIGTLPLGFINAAILTSVIAYVWIHCFIKYAEWCFGKVKMGQILIDVLVMVILLCAISYSTKWSI